MDYILNFLWKHLFVPYEEIVALKPLFNIPFLKKHRVIRTRSLTPFHRLLWFALFLFILSKHRL